MACLFCQFSSGTQVPLVYEDEHVFVIKDIHPQAPHHLLIIPKKHIATLNDLTDSDTELAGHMIQVGKKIAAEFRIDTQGYRLIFNCNADAGQTVFHIHLHLLGGRQLDWPPG
jgi:histidine triad (HIT) family protein